MCVPDCCDPKERPLATEVTPYEKRTCTDILFFFVFLAFWIVIAVIVGNAKQMGGSPYKIIHGSDWQGRICGIDSSVKSLPYAAWPDVSGSSDIRVCVSHCNDTESWDFTVKLKTKPLAYYCIPTMKEENNTQAQPTSVNGTFSDPDQSASRAFGDMFTAWPVIFISGFFAIIISFFYCWLARQLAKCMVVFIVVFMSIGGFLTGYALISAAKEAKDEGIDTNRSKALNALGITMVVGTFLFLITVFALRKRIAIAIEIVREAARALESIPAMAFFPIGPFFLGLAFFVCWVIIALYIMSVSVIEWKKLSTVSYINVEFTRLGIDGWDSANPHYADLDWNKDLKNSFAIHFFYLLWTVQFLVYFVYMVIAGAIATWYFTRYDNDGNKQLPPRVVFESARRTCRFHLGSIALGSGIMAIIQFIRAVLRYLEMQTKKQQPNKLQIVVFRIIQCCLKCVECCCDKVNKNGYVWMAIFGHSFIPSVCNAWMLVWRNLIRIAAVHMVGQYVLLCGKIIVALLTTGLSGLIIKGYYGSAVSSIAMPCFVIFLLSFLVATLFMALFETTIDTVFLCFLIDEEMNKASGQMFASPSLQQLVDAHAQASQELANETLAFRQQKLGQAQPDKLSSSTAPPPTTTTSAPSGGFVGADPTPQPAATSSKPNVF